MRPSPVSFASLVGLLAATAAVLTSTPARPAHLSHRTPAGETRTETRPVTADFRAVTLTASADVVIRQGSPAAITVTGDADDVARTETVIQKGVLRVGTKQSNWKMTSGNHPPLVITVTLPVIEALSVLSSGDLTTDGKITASKLDLQLLGSGDIRLTAEVSGAVTTTVRGSGDVRLTGSCASHTVTLTGSGDVKATEFPAATAVANLTGSGDISLAVNEVFTATVTGSGDIRYLGSPRQLVKRVNGSGSVAKL